MAHILLPTDTQHCRLLEPELGGFVRRLDLWLGEAVGPSFAEKAVPQLAPTRAARAESVERCSRVEEREGCLWMNTAF